MTETEITFKIASNSNTPKYTNFYIKKFNEQAFANSIECHLTNTTMHPFVFIQFRDEKSRKSIRGSEHAVHWDQFGRTTRKNVDDIASVLLLRVTHRVSREGPFILIAVVYHRRKQSCIERKIIREWRAGHSWSPPSCQWNVCIMVAASKRGPSHDCLVPALSSMSDTSPRVPRVKSQRAQQRDDFPYQRRSRLLTTRCMTSRPADCALVPAPYCRARCPASGCYTSVFRSILFFYKNLFRKIDTSYPPSFCFALRGWAQQSKSKHL